MCGKLTSTEHPSRTRLKRCRQGLPIAALASQNALTSAACVANCTMYLRSVTKKHSVSCVTIPRAYEVILAPVSAALGAADGSLLCGWLGPPGPVISLTVPVWHQLCITASTSPWWMARVAQEHSFELPVGRVVNPCVGL
jgi:hypothetical protein